jgi:hypothetical protein
MTKLLVVFVAAIALMAQSPVQTYEFAAVPPPPPANVSANATGRLDSAVYFYWVIARYPIGNSAPAIAPIINAPSALSASAPVMVRWSLATGATGYDVLRTATPTIPGGDCSCAVATALSGSTTSQEDQGAALSSYTLSQPVPAKTSLRLNYRDFSIPAIQIRDSSENDTLLIQPNSAGARLTAGQVVGTFANNSNAATGGITITAAQIVNGILSHNPTGPATDTTDTATNIAAQIPGCLTGSAFNFFLRNTSGGANTITVAGGTGVTVTGTATIAQNNVRSFLGVVTNCTSAAVTFYSLGTTAF